MVNYHHYLQDARIQGGSFSLIPGLAVSDAQWYLKIAETGYPFKPHFSKQKDVVDKEMNVLTYAFFPFYPLLLRLGAGIFHNITLTAFIISNILLVLNFSSMYYIITNLFSKKTALKTIALLFLYPFSIFYWSYFTEGLFLFLLLWLGQGLLRKNYLLSGICVGLLLVTKGTALGLWGVFAGVLFWQIKKKKLMPFKAFGYLAISLVPFLLWLWYCYYQTGDPFYFYRVLQIWAASAYPPILQNLLLAVNFLNLPTHAFHFSKIEVIAVAITGFLLYKSRRVLPWQLWVISLILWVTPLFTKDLTSFARYQSVSFPLFLYLALKLGRGYGLVIGFYIGEFLYAFLAFINWYWVG